MYQLWQGTQFEKKDSPTEATRQDFLYKDESEISWMRSSTICCSWYVLQPIKRKWSAAEAVRLWEDHVTENWVSADKAIYSVYVQSLFLQFERMGPQVLCIYFFYFF